MSQHNKQLRGLGLFLIICSIYAFETTKSLIAKEEVRKLYDLFIFQHAKIYETEMEYEEKLLAFEENLLKVKFRNNEGGTGEAVFGINAFSDLTNAQFSKMFFDLKAFEEDSFKNSTLSMSSTIKAATIENDNDASGFIDWRGSYVTPVKQQGHCGACYAFAGVEQIESDAIRLLQNDGFMKSNSILSVQQVLDCFLAPAVDTNGFISVISFTGQFLGCGGGLPHHAYEFAQRIGLESESDYPYLSGNSATVNTCSMQKSKYRIGVSNFYFINGEDAMRNHISTTGPLAIGICALDWQLYQSGVLTICTRCLNHAVQIVGMNLQNPSLPYWIIRNSWGITWGIAGYIYILYGQGTCGIGESPASYVTPIALINHPTSTPTASPSKPSLAPVTNVPSQPTVLPSEMPSKVIIPKTPTSKPTWQPNTYSMPITPMTSEPTVTPTDSKKVCLQSRYIRIYTSSNYLQISQLAVYNSMNINIAKGKSIIGSIVNNNIDCPYSLSGIVDGILRVKQTCDEFGVQSDGTIARYQAYRSASSSGAFIEIDLAAPYDITKCVYYNLATDRTNAIGYKIAAINENFISTCIWSVTSADQMQIFTHYNTVALGGSSIPTSSPSLLPSTSNKPSISPSITPSQPTLLPTMKPTFKDYCHSVRYVRIDSISKQLSLSQISVFNKNRMNIAAQKSTSASPTYFNYFDHCVINPSSSAVVDGIYNRVKSYCSESVYISNYFNNVFWEVDLGSNEEISEVLLVFGARGTLDPVGYVISAFDSSRLA